jgi:hypothetical protein
MMKLLEQLVAVGTEAEQEAGDLAKNEEQRLKRDQAYARLEQMFGSMCADGQLDAKEIEKLMREFRAQGLDTATLQEIQKQLRNGDATSRVAVTDKMKEGIEEQLRLAEQTNNDPMSAFKTQQIMAKHNHAWDLASRVSKSEHEIYMAAIKHLVA